MQARANKKNNEDPYKDNLIPFIIHKFKHKYLPAIRRFIDSGARRKPFNDILMRFLFLPFAVAFNILKFVMAWKHASIAKYQGYPVAKALIETLSLLASIGAVTVFIAFTAIFPIVGPSIYTGMLAIRSLFSAGSAIYFTVKANRAKSLEERHDFKTKAQHAIADAVLGFISTAVLVCVILFAAPVLKFIGIGLGLVASYIGCLAILSRAREFNDVHEPAHSHIPMQDAAHDITNNASMTKSLGVTPVEAKCPNDARLSPETHDTNPRLPALDSPVEVRDESAIDTLRPAISIRFA